MRRSCFLNKEWESIYRYVIILVITVTNRKIMLQLHHVNKCLFFFGSENGFQHMTCQNTPWYSEQSTQTPDTLFRCISRSMILDEVKTMREQYEIQAPTADLSKLLELSGNPFGEVCWKAIPKKFCTLFPWRFGR